MRGSKRIIVVGLSGIILFASLGVLWQFYYLQDQTYHEVASLLKTADALEETRPQNLVVKTSSRGVRWLFLYDDQQLKLSDLPYGEIYNKDYSNISLTLKLDKKNINTKTSDPKRLINNLMEMLRSNWPGK